MKSTENLIDVRPMDGYGLGIEGDDIGIEGVGDFIDMGGYAACA